jgi:hypothetical protein
MAKAYYSTVLNHSAEKVWSVVRMFDHYAWAGVPGETVIEDDRKGDQVASVRRFVYDGQTHRQILLAHSDIDRSYSFGLCGEPTLPVRDFQATLRVTPVIELNRAFVEWWANFDCAAEDRDRLIDQFEQGGLKVWLGELRRFMDGGSKQAA